MTTFDKSQYSFLPLENLTLPSEGAKVMLNRWWAVLVEDRKIMFFNPKKYVSPQCSHDREIMERLYKQYIDAGIVELVFVPVGYNFWWEQS